MEAKTQTWHCYIDHMESVHSVNVLAVSARDAAQQAATCLDIDGIWTVIAGEAVEVKIREERSYEVDDDA